MKKKTLALILALVMVFGAAVGGTIAWLTDRTAEVKNTFTVGNIDITLKETDADEDGNAANNSYKMVPDTTIDKDPVATVVKGSEKCYLFVKAVKGGAFDSYLTYEMADGWEKLEDGVYYRVVDASTAAADMPFQILKDNQVTVLETVTKDMMNAIEAGTATEPTLTFTAYACQYANGNGNFTAAEAWDKVDK